MNTKSLLTANPEIELRKRQTEAQRVKWKTTGLLEGLDNQGEGLIADLLENQAKRLIKESNRTNTSSGGEEWNGIALPLIRRIFGQQIAAKEFVSIQPLNAPSGLIFWLEFKYATGQPGFTTGAARSSQNDSIWGVTDATKGTAVGTGGLYGAGRFGYSINDVSSSAQTLYLTASAGQLAAGSGSIDSINWTSDINYNTEFSQSLAASSIKKITIPLSRLTNPDTKGVRAFTLTATNVNTVYPQYTAIDSTNTYITFIVSGSLVSSTDTVVFYHKQPTDVTRGDFEEGKTQEANLDMPTFDLQMYQDTLVAKARKLKAQWTPEWAQDIEHYHNIDAQAELVGLLGEYITQEIDIEILDMLIQGAQTIDKWSCRLGYEWGGSAWSQTSANAAMYTQQTWFQTIGTKLRKLSNEIDRLTMRGGATFIVTSPKIATILESIEGYSMDSSGGQMKFGMGSKRMGSINGSWTVYKNPYMTENTMLLGYKGSSFLETGAVYSPYIPLELTPVVYDSNNLTPRIGISTRYAKKLIRPEFYAKLYVEGLETI